MSTGAKPTVRCGVCELNQFVSDTGKCRRCKTALPKGRVEGVRVLVLAVPDQTLRPMREVMRRAAVQAHQRCGGTMRAAQVLGIQPNRLKQLLRETGDETDYRRDRKARQEGRA